MAKKKPTYEELEKLLGEEIWKNKKLDRKINRMYLEFASYKSVVKMPELWIDDDIRLINASHHFFLISEDIFTLCGEHAHLSEFLKEGDFEKVEKYLREASDLRNLPFNEGEEWELEYEGPDNNEKIGEDWIPYAVGGSMEWSIDSGEKNIIRHDPPRPINSDCYLMTAKEYGGRERDLGVEYTVRTSHEKEWTSDLSLVISGTLGKEHVLPDFAGYSACTGASGNTEARIQKQASNMVVVPEVLETNTEYKIIVERTGGRITRKLINLNTGKMINELEFIDTDAIYDGQNHVGFTTYGAKAEIYDVKIYTRKSQFTINQFRIPFDVDVGVKGDDRVFRLRLGAMKAGEKSNLLLLFDDVTERKRAEEALKSSEERLKILFEFAPDGYYLNDLKGNLIDGNRAAELITGYKREELIGKNFMKLDLLSPSQIPKASKLLAKNALGQPTGPDELVLTRKDGIKVHVDIRTFPVKIQDRTLVLGIARDITKRKQAEEAQQARHLRIQQQQAATVKLAINKYIAKGELKKAARMITEVSAKVMGVERVSIWMFSEDRKELRCFDLFERTPNKHSKDMVLYCKDYPRYFDALEKGRAVVAHDARRDSTTSEAGDSYLVPLGITSLLDAAVRISGKVVGVVCHEHVGEQRTWQVDEINFSGEVADHVANALMNTERKQAEEALRENEEKYRHLFKHSPLGIGLSTIDGKVVTGNKAMEVITGYSIEELKNINLIDTYKNQEDRKALIETLSKNGMVVNYQIQLYRKDGSLYDALLNISMVYIGGEDLFQTICMDITERKRAEEALRESEAKYRALFETSADGILVADIETKEFKYANPAICSLLGYSETALTKLSVKDIHPKESLEHVISEFETQARGEKELAVDIPCLRKDGTVVYADINTTKVNIDGKKCNVGFVRDITERKQAEEELKKANEELHRLSTHLETVREKEKAFLAREIHDEFGQLLTALKMELSWIGSKLPDEHKALIEKTKSMTPLIDKGIKTVQKISSRLRTGLLDDLGLKEALEREIQEFERKTPGIKCETDLNFEDIVTEKELSTTVFRILQEALTNISRHAKATLVKVKLKKENDRLVLKIRDNGIGISKDKIFHKNSFGLLGTRERAFHFGGEVNISGRRNKGTTITVTIPLDKKVDSE